MGNSSDLDLKFKDLMESIEKEMDNYILSFEDVDNDQNISNSVKMYLNEISRYPRLTQEEEFELAKNIQNPEKNKLISISEKNNKIKKYSLNEELLFTSLINCNAYAAIIDSLLNSLTKIESHDTKIEDDLVKYKRISKKLDRSLNIDELKKYFDIDVKEEQINELELLNSVKDYITFKYSYDRLYVSNLKLVFSVAKKKQCNIDLLELVSEGNIGLIRAIQKYNPDLGNKFSTCAFYWIMQAIEKYVIKHNSAIKLPVDFYYDMKKFKRDVDDLNKEEKRELTIDEISKKLNIPVEKINEYYSHMFSIVSLDKQFGENQDLSIIDAIVEDDSIDDKVAYNFLKDDIQLLLEGLTESEKKAVLLYFGFGGEGNMTMSYREISKILLVSHARVHQMVSKAIIKMRRQKNTEKIKDLKYYM